jgi:hypothetical protein
MDPRGLGLLYSTGKALDGIRSFGISAMLQSPVGSSPTGKHVVHVQLVCPGASIKPLYIKKYQDQSL